MSCFDEFMCDIGAEYNNAIRRFPGFHSAHEGYAVLLEEVEELWEWVKTKEHNRNHKEMYKECVQIAAMAYRFAHDICSGE